MSYKMTTKKGYDFFEVSSAFQKSVRRGLEEDAMYWACELYFSNYDEYLWKRIKIITCEDIGLASPNLIAVINALYDNYMAIKKKRKEESAPSERLFLTQAVLMLVRAKKSRLVVHASISFFQSHEKIEDKSIPDYAYDRHTNKGMNLKRGMEHFWNEGAKLENEIDLENDKKYLEKAKIILK